MDEIVVKYSIPVEEIIGQSEQMFRRIDELSRTSNENQIRLLQEATLNMGNIIDSYVDRMKRSFDFMFDVFKSSWNLSYSDAKGYFDKIEGLINDNLSNIKKSSDDEVNIEKEKIKQKLDEGRKELDEVKKNTDAKIADKRRELDFADEIKNAYRNVSGGIQTAMGNQGTTEFSALSNIGQNIVGGGAELLSVNYGQGVKDLATALAQSLGLMMNIMQDVDNTKRSIITMIGASGKQVSDIYDESKFGIGPDSNSIMSGLLKLQGKYAGIAEFNSPNMLNTMTGFSTSRTMGNEDYMGMGENTTLLSKARNMSTGELTNFFVEMRMKLDEPFEKLIGRFGQLDKISQDLQINLRKVIQDYEFLMTENQKMGYTQEEVMGLYKAFGSEIKNGTVSVGQLSDYMKGLAGLGTDKSVGGTALLLSQTDDNLLGNIQGDKGGAKRLLQILRQAQSQGGDIEAGVVQTMINNPKADYSQDPLYKRIADKYGLTPQMMEQLNPESERLVQSYGEGFGKESGNLGEGVLREQKIRELLGMPMSNILQESMMKEKGLRTVGTEAGVEGLGTATQEMNGVITNQSKILESSVSQLAVQMNNLKKALWDVQQSFETTYKRTGDLNLAIDNAKNSMMEEMAKIMNPNYKKNAAYKNSLGVSGTDYSVDALGLRGTEDNPSFMDKMSLSKQINKDSDIKDLIAVFDAVFHTKDWFKEKTADREKINIELKATDEWSKMFVKKSMLR